jgi:1,4-dihydroxy-6-naphthoate synthase
MENLKDFTLAYSPCPNDTFIFYNMVHKKMLEGYSIKEELGDVEYLNQSAKNGVFDSTKLSFFAYFHVIDKYKLLNSGSALGSGCGPLIVKKKGKKIGDLKGKSILVPGLLTTANLLTNVYLNSNFTPIPFRYDLIIDKILREEYDAGVIIHEERFTFEKKGLEKIIDLGDFWEGTFGHPIPLGAISIKKSIDQKLQKYFDATIKKSLEMAYANPNEAKSYILQNAQEKDEDIVQSHIDLYVNKYSLDLGEKGKSAIEFLLEKALSLGLIKLKREESLFI